MGFAITPITGKAGRFQCGAGIISFEDCNAEMSVERIEVTGTEDQQADGGTPQNLAAGIRSLKGSLTASVNADQLAAGFLGIIDGSLLTNLKIFLDKNSANRYVGCSFAAVLSVRYQGRIKDKWIYMINFESTGGFNCVLVHPS